MAAASASEKRMKVAFRSLIGLVVPGDLHRPGLRGLTDVLDKVSRHTTTA
ncbi:hypothetical protein [Ornithinimicrobium murale]|nr:hypothetical protein [Ornithinimicrobium murale]